uniref:Putative reverse transcriptase domain-containing protein n=1 Tax=Tanacetum cinerariifolium TaxID=118510 RepID=A0A6L2MT41_TANCI|nr:putative reverse transcriptase domain-containing protein [Tanacetum cinerariifolium]
MVAYLLKTEGSEGFHQIMDFLNTSRIKYALTENPTIYTSLIQQFWQTAAVNTLDTGEVQITATIDRKIKLVSEASIRRHLKLEDSDGISTLPNTKIFKQLALIGPMKTYWEQFSSNIATAIICLATNRTFNFSKMIFEEMVKNLDSAPTTSQPQISSPYTIPTRQKTEVPQPSSPTHTHVADKAASTGVDVRHGGAATTVSSLNAGHGSGHIDKTLSMPHDSPLLIVNKLGSDEGSITLNDLTLSILSLRLEKTVKLSQVRRRAKIVVYDDEELEDPSKQGRSMIEEINQDIEITFVTSTKVLAEVAKVHTYAGRRRAISTASGGISTAEELVNTAGASMPVSTAGMVDKESQRIARVHEEASSFNVDEWEDIQATIEADEELALRIQVEEREKYFEAKKARLLIDLINQRKRYFAQQRTEERRNKPMTQAQQRTYMSNYCEATMKRVQNFTPMESDVDRKIPKIADESSKRATEEELEQESSKRDDLIKLWDLVKERFGTTDLTDDKEKELWVELKRLFEPDFKDKLWKLQRHMHDLLTWRLYDTCGVHHLSTEKGMDIFMLIEKEYLLSKGIMTMMLVNKLLVDQYSKMANKLVRKIFMQKNKKYEWGEEEEALQMLKQKLCSAPILALPDGTEDFVVYCDASLKGFMAVLMQQEKVITYASWQ